MANKTASDIKIYDGASWVSVKSDRVFLESGFGAINANNKNIKYRYGDDWYNVNGLYFRVDKNDILIGDVVYFDANPNEDIIPVGADGLIEDYFNINIDFNRNYIDKYKL